MTQFSIDYFGALVQYIAFLLPVVFLIKLMIYIIREVI